MSLSRQDTSGEEREKKLTDFTVRVSYQTASVQPGLTDNTLLSIPGKDLDKDIVEVEGGDHKVKRNVNRLHSSCPAS